MKIRITQVVQYKGEQLMPGEFHDLDEKTAQKFIDAEMAIAWEEEEKPKRKVKEVNDGNG